MLINVKVIPNASKNQVLKKAEDQFIIRVTTSPEKGKANKKVIELLADFLKVRKTELIIEKGHTSRNKIVRVGR